MRTDSTFLGFERYRFWFLRYLDVADRLLRLHDNVNYIQSYLSMTKEGRRFESEEAILRQQNVSIEVGMILLRFGGGLSHFSLSGIKRCLRQIEAEIEILSAESDFCWENLYQSVVQVYSTDDGVWADSDEAHRLLFTAENKAASERIRYYNTILTRWDSLPPKPAALEDVFRLHYDGLVHLIPFN